MEAKPTIHKYGYDDGKRGLEAEYCLNGGTLFIKIYGSDHWTDYVGNLIAWPRMRGSRGKAHPVWAALAVGLASTIVSTFPNYEDRKDIHIAGHSMGGAVGAILSLFLRFESCAIYTVNAPKAGNRRFSRWLKESTEFVAFHDSGDIVRHLPLFYAKYPNGRSYARTRPFWKAHNNMPDWWASFPDRVVKV